VNYRVEVTHNAQAEADAAYRWLAERTAHAAAWFDGLEVAIESLAELPSRWPLARESEEVVEPVRQLLYER